MQTTISITKRGNRYQARVFYYDKQGKRREKGAGTFDLRREAKSAAEKLEKELTDLNPKYTDTILTGYYWHWFHTYKERAITDKTQNRYKVIGRVLERYFGERKLNDVTRTEYQEFINWYGADHAPDSVTKLNSIVRKMVSFALDDDLIKKDFTSNISLISNKDRKVKVEYLTVKELIRLETAVRDALTPSRPTDYMILTAILTGMRKAEIQALTWSDLDLIHNTITVNKSYDENKKAFKPAKTKTSNRIIKVNRELLTALTDLKANRSTLIFYSPIREQVPTGNALNKELRAIMKREGMTKQGFHFHSLHHVHVAYLLSQGVDIYSISKRLGHANVTTTMNRYSYFIDEYKAKSDDLIIEQIKKLL